MTITPSHIIEYLFCPRYTFFEYVLCIPQHEEKYHKVQKGRMVHDAKAVRNKEYLRKKIGVKEKWLQQYLTNDYLRGEVDEVILLYDDTMAPLDYKFAFYNDKVYDTYKTQLFCYAWLIEDNFNKPVNKGYLVYTRSRNKLIEIDIEPADKEKVKHAAAEVLKIIDKNFYPKATKYKKRCVTCTYKNICIK
ncbi:MAG: CRISPR-associated protein Cas4 [Bacteroidales bacterium]|nr:CRISPR-associated protein Cas4 [Bacteroidales bacterium]